jgi:hypothetical protein
MPGSGMSILRRLFPSPVTIVSYSPEFASRRDGDKLTNWGRRCVGKSQKTVPRTFELRIALGKLYALGDSRGHWRFLGQKYDLNMEFGCVIQELMNYSG